MTTRLVYLVHPAGAPTREEHRSNLARAKRWFAWAAGQPGVSVIADWIIYCEVWDDFDPALRAVGLDADDAAIRRCDEVWLVGGRISAGMQRAAQTARLADKIIRDLMLYGDEPPECLLDLSAVSGA